MDLKQLDFYKLAWLMLGLIFIVVYYQSHNNGIGRYVTTEDVIRMDTKTGALYNATGEIWSEIKTKNN